MHSYQIWDTAQKEIHFYSPPISNSILLETFHAPWDMFCEKVKSRDIYFQRDFHSAFTVLSNIQIIQKKR